MYRFLVLLFVAVWLLSFVFGRKKRLIRDVNHLLHLLVWVLLAFTAATAMGRIDWLSQRLWLYLPAVAVMFWLTYLFSGLLAKKLFGGKSS